MQGVKERAILLLNLLARAKRPHSINKGAIIILFTCSHACNVIHALCSHVHL